MPKGKRRIQVVMTPATKLAADLMKLAERINKKLSPKFDSANIRTYLNDAREQITMAATQVGQLPETWKPGKARKTLSADALKKAKDRLAKLQAQIAEAEAQA